MDRRKGPPTYGRLIDEEFDELHKLCSYAVEGCVDSSSLKGHRNLPLYSEQNYLLYHDLSGQTVYCEPPWPLAIMFMEHLCACHSKSPLDTRSVIILPD